MPFQRLLAGAAVATLVAGSALAQTGGSMQPSSPNGATSMQSPTGSAQPYAAPPTTGGTAQPDSGSMSDGVTTGASPSSGSMGAVSGTAFTPIRPTPGGNIIATLTASGEFTKLLAALQATNLTGLISTHPNLTLFAPTDAAFAALPPGQLDMLMKSPPQLQAILTYHLVAATIKPTDVMGHAAGKVPTAAKKSVTLDGSGPTLKVDTASVLQPGVTAANGIIYPIDKVLTPSAM